MSLIEYKAQTHGNQYGVGTESCEILNDISDMKYIVKRYPKIRNLYYGWDCCGYSSNKPKFVVKDPVLVLYDVWKHISKINNGVYLLAVESSRALNIYKRRWLTDKNNFEVLEAGENDKCRYVIVRKS